MGQLRVKVLGRPAVEHDGARVRLSSKATALLGYLAATGQPESRAALSGLLWGELSGDRARANLRMVLAELRRTLGPHVEISVRDVGPGAAWQVDLRELRTALALRDRNTASRVMELARGGLLEGLDIPGAPGFDAWLSAEREHVRRSTIDGLTALADTTARHHPQQALVIGRELLALDPLDEAAHRLVMELLAATGRRAAALAQYETCRLLLAEELGVDPSPETVRLHDRLLREDATAAQQPRGPTGPGGRADTGATVRASAQPALRRLPMAADQLVGRDAEVERIRALFAGGACRLLTLVGPGGVGKTRLAVATADALAERFADGVAFVSLAALPAAASEDAVAGAVAQALAVPPWRDSPRVALQRHLVDRQLLVVLDNVEHLAIADLVRALLAAAPGLTVLATSRRRIGLGDEWLLDVEGLPYPERPGADLERSPAVALFAARAQRVRSDFAVADHPDTVLRICELVDGLPLALQLAADWLRVLAPGDVARLIASDLDALATEHGVVEPRQRSMRSVLDASWQLLDADQQRMLARLSVFRGGFDAEAGRAVAGASPADLGRLVDRCVVQRRRGSRFDLHELLRQFASERLEADGADAEAVRALHASYFAAVARTRGPALADDLEGADDTLEADVDNLRDATRWLIAVGDEEQLAACVACLWRLDERRGRFAEALATLEEALARVDVAASRAATWHRWAGTAAFQLGRMERALAELEAAFAALGQPLPRRAAALLTAIVREAARQVAHRLVPGKFSRGDGDSVAERIETLSLLTNTMYFLQRPLPVALYALLEANTADRSDDPGVAGCAYAELAAVLESCGWRGPGSRYGRLADANAARAPDSAIVSVGLESRVLSHLGMAEWGSAEAQISRAMAIASASGVSHRLVVWHALSGASSLFRGRFAASLDAFETGLDVAKTVGDHLAFVWCANGVTNARLGLGHDAAPLVPLQSEALERSRDLAAPERLKTLTVLAALRLAAGRTQDLLALARAAHTAAGEVRIAPVWTLDAYSHLAQVWLALWDEAGEPVPELVRGSRLAIRRLERFARVYRMATARSWWAQGWLAWLDGRPHRARAAWRRSLDAAERMEMPYDQARAHVALAGAAPQGTDGATHHVRAQFILAELGARPALLHLCPTA